MADFKSVTAFLIFILTSCSYSLRGRHQTTELWTAQHDSTYITKNETVRDWERVRGPEYVRRARKRSKQTDERHRRSASSPFLTVNGPGKTGQRQTEEEMGLHLEEEERLPAKCLPENDEVETETRD